MNRHNMTVVKRAGMHDVLLWLSLAWLVLAVIALILRFGFQHNADDPYPWIFLFWAPMGLLNLYNAFFAKVRKGSYGLCFPPEGEPVLLKPGTHRVGLRCSVVSVPEAEGKLFFSEQIETFARTKEGESCRLRADLRYTVDPANVVEFARSLLRECEVADVLPALKEDLKAAAARLTRGDLKRCLPDCGADLASTAFAALDAVGLKVSSLEVEPSVSALFRNTVRPVPVRS